MNLDFLARGESVQIVAPAGFGKSRFARKLSGLLIDPNVLQSPSEILNTIKSSSERKLIILDSFDEILREEYRPVFKYLKGLRDQHKYQLAYVFLTHKLIGPEYQPLLGDLYELISEHIEYLPVLTPKDYDFFGWKPSKAQISEIEKLSGGIPTLVKICVFALRDGKDLQNPKLEAAIAEMLADNPAHPAYLKSQLIQDYLQTHAPLSASETKLLELFNARKGQVVCKDDICQAIYPEVKNRAGITDHAIDQLVHRLRTKIKHRSIMTLRGRGYQLAD